MGTECYLYPYLFNMFPTFADIYQLYRSVTDAKHSTDGRVGQVCFSKQTLDFTHLVRLQFSLTIAFSLIISSLLFAPMQVFFASTPMEIISTIIGAIIVYMVYVSLFGQRFAVKGSTDQPMYKSVLGFVYYNIQIAIGCLNRFYQCFAILRIAMRNDTFHPSFIGNRIRRILYTYTPFFIRQVFNRWSLDRISSAFQSTRLTRRNYGSARFTTWVKIRRRLFNLTNVTNFRYTFISQDNFTSYVKLLRLGLPYRCYDLAT